MSSKRRRLTVEERHQLAVARRTLRMSDAVGVMGGPSKQEARRIIARLTAKK